jgi:hypothetical protein
VRGACSLRGLLGSLATLVVASNAIAEGAHDGASAPGAARSTPGTHVRLRGAARIEAQGVRADSGDMIVRGALLDDAGAPISDGALTVSIARASALANAIALGGDAVRACTPEGKSPRVFTDGVHVAVDRAGRFCVRIAVPIDRYVAHVGYAGAGYIDGGALDVPVDLTRRTCVLAISPPEQGARVIQLDASSVSIDATATLESDGASAPGVGYSLTLATEGTASPVASATTDLAGHARFTLTPSKLGPPGRGELRLSFAGNGEASAASRVVPVERRAQVDLDVAGAQSTQGTQGKMLAPGAPEDGVSFVVTARAAGGEVTSGSVEARVGDSIVGAAPIEGGSAKLEVTFGLPESSGATGQVPIALRYVPSAPWFEPGAESTWTLPVRARSSLREVWVVLGGLAVAAWFVVARAQRAKALATIAPRPREAPRGEAKLDVVSVARNAGEGWSGRVIDADDATAIGTARVQIERPSFGRAEVLASVVADEDGRFELPATGTRPGDELAIEAPLHVALRRPLPAPGELDAQLVQRKRAMLGRLVTWAKQRGRPFDARPEPTPGHVRHAAGDDFRVARWADAVERAAYAGDPVDAHVEAEVDRLAPAPVPVHEARPVMDKRALLNPTKPNR